MKPKIENSKVENAAKYIDEKYKDKFIDFLSMYRHEEFMYFNVIQRNLKISKEEVQKIVNILIEHNIAILGYRHFCTNCSRDIGSFIEANEIDDFEDVYCDFCDEIISKDSKNYMLKII